jgi:hypothetical protein
MTMKCGRALGFELRWRRTVWYVRSNALGRGYSDGVRVDDETQVVIDLACFLAGCYRADRRDGASVPSSYRAFALRLQAVPADWALIELLLTSELCIATVPTVFGHARNTMQT